MSDARDLLNRPMLLADLPDVEKGRGREIIELVDRYRRQFLPVMNGGLAYSNLLEGRDQILTCNPYRLWEYSSLFLELDRQRQCKLFVDVGGAASPLPFILAENGFRGYAVDLQPHLVALSNYVSTLLHLPLSARVADVTADVSDLDGLCDVVTFVSVLEHIPAESRPLVMRKLYNMLCPGGLLYITFDYGDYLEEDTYRAHERKDMKGSRSIGTVKEFADLAENAGFRFLGNNPRTLPEEVQRLQQAPGRDRIMWRYTMNSPPFDASTPWRLIAKYVIKRLIRRTRAHSRFEQHNFFRSFLEKPA